MVTIKQALTNTHGASIRRTLKDIKVGEAFKWVIPRGQGGSGWCVRVDTCIMQKKNGHETFWMPLEGEGVGFIWTDHEGDKAEIHQP